jgi:hypothetical protein
MLGEEDFTLAMELGGTMGLDEAMAFALSETA